MHIHAILFFIHLDTWIAVMHHNPTAAQGQRLAPLPRPSGVPRASSSASQPLMWTPGRTTWNTVKRYSEQTMKPPAVSEPQCNRHFKTDEHPQHNIMIHHWRNLRLSLPWSSHTDQPPLAPPSAGSPLEADRCIPGREYCSEHHLGCLTLLNQTLIFDMCWSHVCVCACVFRFFS
jgi:hypothetical protein